jgi:hypothetical protein
MEIQEADLYREISNFFMRVTTKMKTPSIRLRTADETQTIRMAVAGSQARFPGSINVTDPNQIVDGMPVWYGRIKDGEFEPSAAGRAHAGPLKSALMRFICDPVEGARDFARLTGNCSFCNLPLTDDRSQIAGYGKICAAKYQLPWG